MRWIFASALLAASAIAAAAPLRDAPRYEPHAWGDRPGAAQLARIGQLAFAEPALSASGRLSCASCHDPAHHFGPPGAALMDGGADGRQPARRAVPALGYHAAIAPFAEHRFDDEDGHGEDAGPTGGFTWDGRAATLQQQALIPLFAPHEMANVDAADLAARLARTHWAGDFRAAFSAPRDDVLRHPDQTLGWLAAALAAYQQAPAFSPYGSRYDAVLRGQAVLAPAEARGLAVFIDPQRGNCATCHPATRRADGALPRFTDDGYAALAVPRQRMLAANADPAFFDLGLCGPERADLARRAELCGLFRTPSLRNVATRHGFFHNARFATLREVLDFYATRDTEPARWYPGGAFDDLPTAYADNVERGAPFAPLADGRPRLSTADIDDLLAFLQTLTDGWRPAGGAPH